MSPAQFYSTRFYLVHIHENIVINWSSNILQYNILEYNKNIKIKSRKGLGFNHFQYHISQG